MRRIILWCSILIFAWCPLFATGEEIQSTAHDRQAVSVTIYTKNLALIKDERRLSLPSGTQTLAFREVSAQIRPQTAQMRAQGVEVLEQNFEYDLLTPHSLLQKYVGREVTLIKTHPTTGEEQPARARVLSAGQGVVLRVGDRIETEVSGRLVYGDVPATLRDRPTLTMQVQAEQGGERQAELTYLTGGLSWQADYVAELNAADDRLALNGWVTLTNESGISYPQARLQLVAGDVNVVSDEPRAMDMMKGAARAEQLAAAPQPMAEEAMFEYHLYTLGRPTTIGENQKKQVSLLQAGDVRCRKEFLLRGQDYYYSASAGEIGRKLKVGVHVEMENDKEQGLGLPLPGGVVRVYKKDGGGMLQFIGEDRIEHTAEKERVRLKLGDAFDLTADKRQTEFKKLSGFSPFQYSFESGYEIVVRNAKKEQVTVKIQEPVPGDWEILSESIKHRKEDAKTAVWMLVVPPMDSATLTYRVRVKY